MGPDQAGAIGRRAGRWRQTSPCQTGSFFSFRGSLWAWRHPPLYCRDSGGFFGCRLNPAEDRVERRNSRPPGI